MVRLDLSPPSECQMRGRHLAATTSEHRSIPGRLGQRGEDRFNRGISPVQVRDEVTSVGFRAGLYGRVASRRAALILLHDLTARRRLKPPHDAVAIEGQVRHYVRDRPFRKQARRRSCRIG